MGSESVNDPELAAAYAACRARVAGHYENFPVASVLLPKRLRDPVAVIYSFAREADDIADEGDLTADERLGQLDAARDRLHAIEAGETPDTPLYLALVDVIRRHRLPVGLLQDLLAAFRQDVVKRRYETVDELLDYCRLSANPVGRLLLHLFDQASDRNLRDSDAICTALQLANLWQDLDEDLRDRDRIYLPRSEMERFGVTVEELHGRHDTPGLQRLLAGEIGRAEGLMRSGMPLGGRLRGRFGVEIRVTVNGGLAILAALQRRSNSFDRPLLGRRERLSMVVGGLFPTRRWRP